MSRICHIAPSDDWERAVARGEYVADSLSSQGFIHCSAPEQLIPVADFLFRGRTDLVLLEIDEGRVEQEIRYENCDGGEKLFPHVYGPIATGVVVNVHPFRSRW